MGNTGPMGPAGPTPALAGSLVLRGYTVVTKNQVLLDPGDERPVYVVYSCPTGHVALSGGFSATGGQSALVALAGSIPQLGNGGLPSEWAFAFRFLKRAFPQTVAVYVTCAIQS
jgi:hypothetical protein